jgi:hypothetical protein
MTPASESPTSARCRFWPRFTLRVLLVFVTMVGIGLGYWTHRAREQARVVRLIQDGGGMVCYERDGPTAPDPRNFAVEWLAARLGRDYFEGITAAGIRERESVQPVSRLHELQQLQIFCDEVNDEDIQALARCRHIEVLNIGVGVESHLTKVTDRSLAMLAALPRLRVIHLHAREISEAGIQTIASLPTLEVLDIGSCDASVDASDLEVIKRQGRIQSLVVWRRAKSGSLEIIARWLANCDAVPNLAR